MNTLKCHAAWLLTMLFCLNASGQNATRQRVVALTDKAVKSNEQFKFKESLMLSREALSGALELKDYGLLTRLYNIIGANHEDLSQTETAIGYYKKSLKYAQMAKSDSLQSVVHNNLGNIYYYDKKDIAKGEAHYAKALAFAALAGDEYGAMITRINLALANFDLNQKDKGFEHLTEVNKTYSRLGDEFTHSLYYIANANYATYKNNPQQAYRNFEQAIQWAKKSNFMLELAWAYDDYAKFLVKEQKYDRGYEYLRLSKKLEDSIYDEDKLRAASDEGLYLELDEYRRSLSKLEAEKEIQELSLRKSNIIQLLFIGLSLILIVWLYSVYRHSRQKRTYTRALEQANIELRLARDKAEEASRLKSQFVSTITHELRTPLYGVVGITNMILDEHRELAGSQHLNSLKFSAKYLLSLVNDILQINKMEESRLVLEKHTFNLADEISTIKNSMQFLANKNNNELIAEIDTDIPEMLLGDKLRLSQVLMNLISNALKFTQDGEVIVSAEQVKVDGKLHYLKFKVCDTGIGIAEADQEKVFDKFVQIERKTDDYQGTGLGLSIVRRLIEAFGSEIHLKSEEGKGTEFAFTIAFEYDLDQSNAIIANIDVDLSSGQIYHILVVEDNKINQVVTKKIIENANYRCTLADDGESALAMIDHEKFDAILMDINMPGINGFETTRILRRRGINTPVIALTAFDKEEITEEALAAGINDIIVKPFEPVKLFRIIRTLTQKTN